jgi:uncharacterized protein with GYD domain
VLIEAFLEVLGFLSNRQEYHWTSPGRFDVKVSSGSELHSRGLQGLIKDKASGRKTAITEALANVGGILDAIYFTLGERDVLLVCDCPDYASVAALGLAASASGMVRTKITPLLTVEEVDQTIAKGVNYRPPGT